MPSMTGASVVLVVPAETQQNKRLHPRLQLVIRFDNQPPTRKPQVVPVPMFDMPRRGHYIDSRFLQVERCLHSRSTRLSIKNPQVKPCPPQCPRKAPQGWDRESHFQRILRVCSTRLTRKVNENLEGYTRQQQPTGPGNAPPHRDED